MVKMIPEAQDTDLASDTHQVVSGIAEAASHGLFSQQTGLRLAAAQWLQGTPGISEVFVIYNT